MNSHRSTLDKTIHGGGTLGWGPFVIGGGYTSNKKQRDYEYHFTGEGLVSPGVQLLGYVSTIFPASPKVDSKEYMQNVKATGVVAPH